MPWNSRWPYHDQIGLPWSSSTADITVALNAVTALTGRRSREQGHLCDLCRCRHGLRSPVAFKQQ
ncbi:conserved hypothetical protein, partial [Ricinus communis]